MIFLRAFLAPVQQASKTSEKSYTKPYLNELNTAWHYQGSLAMKNG